MTAEEIAACWTPAKKAVVLALDGSWQLAPCEGFFTMPNGRNASVADGTNGDSTANKAEFADHNLTTDYPHLRKVGRYLFYAPCAFGLGTSLGVALLAVGVARDLAVPTGNLAAFFAFLALRDIEKNAFIRARKGMDA